MEKRKQIVIYANYLYNMNITDNQMLLFSNKTITFKSNPNLKFAESNLKMEESTHTILG